MQSFNIHEAKTQLSKLIEKVKNGEEITISKAGIPIIKLVLFTETKKARTPGSWQGKIKIAEDFNTLPENILNEFYE